MDNNYRQFLLEYYHDGAWWNVTISATSFDDAHKRLAQLQYAKVLGTVEMEIPARFGLFARMACWLQNVWRLIGGGHA